MLCNHTQLKEILVITSNLILPGLLDDLEPEYRPESGVLSGICLPGIVDDLEPEYRPESGVLSEI